MIWSAIANRLLRSVPTNQRFSEWFPKINCFEASKSSRLELAQKPYENGLYELIPPEYIPLHIHTQRHFKKFTEKINYG